MFICFPQRQLWLAKIITLFISANSSCCLWKQIKIELHVEMVYWCILEKQIRLFYYLNFRKMYAPDRSFFYVISVFHILSLAMRLYHQKRVGFREVKDSESVKISSGQFFFTYQFRISFWCLQEKFWLQSFYSEKKKLWN